MLKYLLGFVAILLAAGAIVTLAETEQATAVDTRKRAGLAPRPARSMPPIPPPIPRQPSRRGMRDDNPDDEDDYGENGGGSGGQAPAPIADDGVDLLADVEEPAAPDRDQVERELTSYRAELDRIVENESIDESWAGEVSDQLRSTVDDLASDGVSVSRLDCRTTMCKLDLNVSGGVDPMAFMDAVSGKPGFRLPGFAHLVDGEGGERTIHIFIGRDEAAIPPFSG